MQGGLYETLHPTHLRTSLVGCFPMHFAFWLKINRPIVLPLVENTSAAIAR